MSNEEVSEREGQGKSEDLFIWSREPETTLSRFYMKKICPCWPSQS